MEKEPTEPLTPEALTFRRSWVSFSEPVLLEANDGHAYVVKALHGAGRGIVSEQIAGRLGAALGAPVPPVALIHLPARLIASTPELARFSPGLAHGSRFIPDCRDQESFRPEHLDEPANRDRFALLWVLYSWLGATREHQLLYRRHRPFLVYSVDHGHILPGGVKWTAETLATAPAYSDPWFEPCRLGDEDRQLALERLAAIRRHEIEAAVAAPPGAWGIGEVERTAVLGYLLQRRDELLSQCQ